MNTPAHLLIGLALCARRTVPKSGRMAAAGSLLPDLSLYLLAGVALVVLQIPPERVFGELYYSDAWQAVFAIDNSAIIWGAALGLALWRGNAALVALTSAGLLHIATDLPLHHDDGRPHFWPVTGWIFESPVSYWDSAHHAGIVAPLELAAVLVSVAVLWRRWPGRGARAGIALALAAELWVIRQWLLFF